MTGFAEGIFPEEDVSYIRKCFRDVVGMFDGHYLNYQATGHGLSRRRAYPPSHALLGSPNGQSAQGGN